MQTILVDTTDSSRLSPMRYPLINDIVRNNNYNVRQMWKRIGEKNLNLFNQNMLVGLLQTLAVDPTWTLEYVMTYAKFRSRSLCSAFKIISNSNREGVHKDTLFYGGCTECFCLLEKTRDLSKLELMELNPLVPIYSTLTNWTYNPSAERERVQQFDYSNDFAYIGINIVELAVGWWKYMNDPRYDGHGIHHYLANIVTPKFGLQHNQLAYFNALHAHIVNRVGYSELLEGEGLDFNIVGVRKGLTAMLTYQVKSMKASTWKTHQLLQNYLETELTPELVGFFNAQQYDLNYNPNVIWGFELNAVKYYQIYFALCNELSYTPNSIAGTLKRFAPLVENRWKQIDDVDFRKHAIAMLKQLDLMNA
jgi:hypothetical protein